MASLFIHTRRSLEPVWLDCLFVVGSNKFVVLGKSHFLFIIP